MWYMYIAQCDDGSFYTGLTSDVERRIKEHSTGKGGHFTAYRKPQKIVYSEAFTDKLECARREQQVKKWSRAKKQALIDNDFVKLRKLSISND